MEKIYITKSRIYTMGYHISQSGYVKDEIKEFFEWRFLKSFNHKELKTMSAVAKVLEAMVDEDLWENLIKKIGESRSYAIKENYVFNKNTPPVFHADEKCAFLQKEYKNYEIPPEIPKERYDEYRQYFIKNIDLYEKNEEFFFARAELKFGVAIRSIKTLRYLNSGNIKCSISDRTNEEVLTNMDNIANAMYEFEHKNKVHQKIVRNTGYNTTSALKQSQYKEYQDIIEQWGQYKKEMRNLIQEYIITLYNPERRFSRELLTNLGFKPCAHCLRGH